MDYKGKTEEELHRIVAESREKLRVFRFAMAGGKAKNVKEGKALRKEIARMLTELTRRKSEARSTKSETKPENLNV